MVETPLDEGGTTLLHLAANCDTPAILQLLLDYGADPNAQDDDGYTALHVAALWGKADLTKLLLEHGADPTLYDFEELLPVDHARNEGTHTLPNIQTLLLSQVTPTNLATLDHSLFNAYQGFFY